jgi:hypothetical protein
MRCTSCSADVADGSRFCPACGRPVHPASDAGQTAGDIANQALITAQLASATYLKALFVLAIAALFAIVTGAAAVNVQQQNFLTCIRHGDDCTSLTPAVILIAGGLLSIALITVAVLIARKADGHRELAGG